MAQCPVCDTEIEIEADELDEGDTVTCDECGADLTVTGVDPLELESADDEEDEDEEDEDVDVDEEDDEEDEDEDEEDEDEDWK
jgi:alpha-aminoadipate/glutamate carrier protein LysW